MNKEILQVIEAVSAEKELDKEIIFEALEMALATAARKQFGEDIDVRVSMDRKSGALSTFRRWKVFADDSTELETPEPRAAGSKTRSTSIRTPRSTATSRNRWTSRPPAASWPRPPSRWSCRKCARPSAAQVVEEFRDRVGTLIGGIVKRVDRNGVYVDLGGNAEGFIAREEMIPREAVRTQDRIKGYLREVRSEPRGPQIFLSRTAPEFIIELFKLEVPEVGQGLIRSSAPPATRAIAPRSPSRAWTSASTRSAPASACAARACRPSPTSWPASAWTSSLGRQPRPVRHQRHVAGRGRVHRRRRGAHSMDVAVEEEKLSQAIGRGGQNVRLASELSGWELNVMTADRGGGEERKRGADADRRLQDAARRGRGSGGDPGAGGLLQHRGDRLRARPRSCSRIEEFDEDIVEELRNRARDVLITQAIVKEEKLDQAEPAEDLLELEGMDRGLAFALASRGIRPGKTWPTRPSTTSPISRAWTRARRQADHGGPRPLVRERRRERLNTRFECIWPTSLLPSSRMS
jgi:transcription termination/antitermination protein NusA